MVDASPDPRAPSWQQRIGGRWAVSWQAYGIGIALNAPLLVLTGGAIGGDPVDPGDMPRWAVVALAAAAATALWVLIGDRVLFPTRAERPVPVAAVVGYHAVTGLIFTAAIWIVGPLVGLAREGTLVETALPTVAIGLWFGLTMILLLDARDRFARRRTELLDEAVAVEVTSLREDEATDRVTSLIRERVGAVTEDLRAEVSAALDAQQPGEGPALTDADWTTIADRVRDSAESALRPLSHELWRSTALQFPRPRWGDVLRQSILTGSFWAAPSMAIVLIGYLRGGMFALGPLAGAAAALVLAGAVGLLLVAANSLMARAGRWRVGIAAVAFVTVQLLGIAFTQLMSSMAASPAELLGSVLGMTVSVVAPAVVAALNSAREQVLERLQRTTDGARARQIAQARQLAETTQQAARIIHGTLQTRLMAAAAAIDQAVASGREDLLAEALGHVSEILDGAQASAASDRDADATVVDLVQRMCAAWNGIMEVTVQVSPDAGTVTGQGANAVGLIVEEALANAYRHGRADTVRVVVDAIIDDSGAPVLEVSVKDDGTGGEPGSTGLGTVLIQRLSDGRVTFEREPDGFHVRAQVSRAPD